MARATVMVVFTVLYIYAPEVFPTSIRGSAVGTANAMARVGGMLAPFLSVELVEDGRYALSERERGPGGSSTSHGRWKRPCLQTTHMTL
jgi:hypothetical protein